MRTYFITEEQFVRGSAYAFAPTRRKLAFALAVVPLPMVPLLHPNGPGLLELFLFYVVLIVFMAWIAPAVNRWMFRRIYRNNPMLHRQQFFEINDEGVRLQSENGESRYRFGDLKKVRVFPEMVLIYPMTTLFHMLPRDQLTEAEVELLARCGDS